jgi:hypothetical protein
MAVQKKTTFPIVRTLLDLNSTEFEHLVYDLVRLRGANNVSWRTPGADGGRDIEAVVGEMDFSGYVLARKWYVECKRYASSIDWPTIYQKLAYADSQGAAVLLMCATTSFTPNAISEVCRWNSSDRRVQVRLWPIHELQSQLLRHPDLSLKYGLVAEGSIPGRSLLALSLATSKCVSSHYSRQVFEGRPIDQMLAAAQAMSDLIQRRMEDLNRTNGIQPAYFDRASDAVSGVTNDGRIDIDGFALKAIALYVSALTSSAVLCARISERHVKFTAKGGLRSIVERYQEAFDAIALWGDLEIEYSATAIDVRSRKSQ